MKKNQQRGFTLVELIVVIVVLGLLAVAALPRFVDVTEEAKKSSIEGVAGGFATAVLSARAQWEAEARPNISSDNYVNYDGTEFWLTRATNNGGNDTGFRNGYPYALKTSDSAPGQGTTNARCIELMENLLQSPPKVGTVAQASSDSSYKYSAEADGAADTCTYVQREGSSEHEFVYELTTGRVTVTLE
ncbi:prepilin-type N-terminal cleavage/methylation domain-containing protein [Vibrio astriarenae]|uniref:Prepilin-type N-terminal cleavage/methylation domain-containing protein n=1 Tax=Vibrio astriarenae TaxID=1481923 RepID=A0A7Z2YEC8_9VIBR|nr:prepilin-type N-terminal cleavage/methylation domain-containing protein [Vibrio astriarenae]QIA64307.1 prepilin-type N-terminal cleavage/methylation domain-containing protein [Vibrio astriarenae]